MVASRRRARPRCLDPRRRRSTLSRHRAPQLPTLAVGKISTFVQIVFLCFQIGYLSGIPVAAAVAALKWLTVALAVASLADYARRITTAESR